VAKHIILTSPDEDHTPVVLALPITTIDDHSSETQLTDWKASLAEPFRVLNEVFGGTISEDLWRLFIRKVCGGRTDHANDQLCLMINLFVGWKREVDRELRGEEYLRSLTPLQLLQLLQKHGKSDAAGPAESWESLPFEERVKRVSAAVRELVLPFGEDAYHKLTDEEKFAIDMFIWAGCCMHKGQNAAKEGYFEMTGTWPALKDATPPVCLLNKDNTAAFEHGSQDERERILASAKAGAWKATELLGALLKNKDSKKGQQELYKIQFEVFTRCLSRTRDADTLPACVW
jgi:hypothetical protein